MNGQRPPIPGSNEPLIVACLLVPMWGRLAGVRPDVTRCGGGAPFRARAPAQNITLSATQCHLRALNEVYATAVDTVAPDASGFARVAGHPRPGS